MDVAPPPTPDPADSLFLQDDVLEVEIEMAPGDLEALKADSLSLGDVLRGTCLSGPVEEKTQTFEAVVQIDGQHLQASVEHWGFLEESHSSRPSLLLDLDPNEEGTRLRGLRRVRLSSERRDPTRIVSCLSLSVMRESGLTVPRCGLVNLKVNGQEMGVYAHIEALDERFIAHHFGDPELPLWRGQLSDFREGLRARFAPQNEAARRRSDPFEELSKELSDLEEPEALSEWVDLEQFARFWASERFLLKENAYSSNGRGFALIENSDGRLVFIPEASSEAMGLGEAAVQALDLPASALPWALLQHEEGRQLVEQGLNQLLSHFNPELLRQEFSEMSSATLTVDEGLEDNEDWLQALQLLTDFIDHREERVLAEIKAAIKAPQTHMEEAVCLEQVGALKASFSTTWDSLESADPFHQGEASLHLTLHGEARAFPQIGGVAGPTHTGKAFVGVAALLDDSEALLALAEIPISAVREGSEMEFDFDEVHGVLSRSAAETQWNWESIAWMDAGYLRFEEAGDGTENAIVGEMEAELLQFAQ